MFVGREPFQAMIHFVDVIFQLGPYLRVCIPDLSMYLPYVVCIIMYEYVYLSIYLPTYLPIYLSILFI